MTRTNLTVVFSATLALLSLALSTNVLLAQSRSYPPEFPDAREEVYKQIGDVELKLWVFEPQDHQRDDSRPAIVFFFGGGWKSGSPSQFVEQSRFVNQLGMVAIVADYRVRQRHQTLATRCVADAKSAIRWVRQHASELGVDPNRIVAAGGSAGGHLAACTALLTEFDEPDESSEVSSRPNALALFNPALVLDNFDGVRFDPEKLADLTERAGVDTSRISPIHHVKGDLPPTIIFHGEADTTVPFSTVKRFSEVASELGNQCELVGYPGAGHGFFNHGRGGDPGEHYLDTMYQLHRFLNGLGYVESKPIKLGPDSTNVRMRGRFDHVRQAIERDKKATIAFIGGSITEMNGYRAMMENWFRERFPETEFTFVNAGISSTCSTTGAFRLASDVLSHDPDLLLIEFAVNDDQDAAHGADACIRGMEGILRHARETHPEMDMLVTYFVNPPMLDSLHKDETPTSIAAHEKVASHYAVSTVQLAQEVADQIGDGELTWKEYGGTHPKKPGNSLAASLVQDLLTAAWRLPQSEQRATDDGLSRRVPKPLDKNSYVRGRWISPADAEHGDGWDLGRPDWSSIKGSLRDRFAGTEFLSSSTAGAELTLSFEGTAIGIYVLAGPDAGEVEYSIDGGEPRTVDLYHRFSKSLHYPRTVMLDDELKRGRHKLKLRLGDKPNTAVRIIAFAAN